MVSTKSSEVAGKGWGWYAIPSSSTSLDAEKNDKDSDQINNKTTPTSSATATASASSLPSSPSSYRYYESANESLQSANESLQQAAESAYSGIANAYSYFPSLPSSSLSSNADAAINPATATATLKQKISQDNGASSSSLSTTSSSALNNNNRRQAGRAASRMMTTQSLLSPSLLKLIHNPYIGVRGGGRQNKAKPPHESMDAVRKLLYVVDGKKKEEQQKQNKSLLQHEAATASAGQGAASPVGAYQRPTSPSSSSPSQYDGNNYDDDHKNATIPLPPLTPSRPPLPTQTTSSTDDSSTATPRHRNTTTACSTLNNNNNNNNNRQQHQRQHQRQPSPVRSFLPRLSSIDSIPQQQYQQEQEQNHAQSNPSSLPPSLSSSSPPYSSPSSSSSSPEETASQLTEGTLRALRDLALDEAVELHASLKYWSDRWERPIFSWFVAGPLIWFGIYNNNNNNNNNRNNNNTNNNNGGGYDHAIMVGQKVSQIQAVLARRLSAIGELQQHLLRAGWQRGVAQWGFLGEGGDWAAVAGTDGRMVDDSSSDESFDAADDHADDVDVDVEEENDAEHNNYEQEIFLAGNAGEDNSYSYSNLYSLDHHHHHHQEKQQQHQQHNHRNRYRPLRREFSEASVGSVGLHLDVPYPPPPELSTPRMASKISRLSQHEERRKHDSLYYTNLHVRKRNGGQISKDDPALAEWSIDAMALIRSQLYRAANGKIILPFSENWPFEFAANTAAIVEEQVEGGVEKLNLNGDDAATASMPAWAISRTTRTTTMMDCNRSYPILENVVVGDDDIDNNGLGDGEFSKIGADCFDNPSHSDDETNVGGGKTPTGETHSNSAAPEIRRLPRRRSQTQQRRRSSYWTEERVVISNLPLMMNEVSGLLDVMEDIIDIQRARRLEKLKPPPWWRQNWFLVAMASPSLAYLFYNIAGKGHAWSFVKYAAEKVLDFTREHVVLPCVALYDEFTKGPESISDHAARDTATETLKKMIRSWLDETYPEMLEAEKLRLSDSMDISLVEESKEQGMKSVYNMNSVIRMSFIEAQFIKKEMMNALVALDEMQASTNFNMNLAAITPFVLLIWTAKKISTFIFYTTFKWGKSRKETYKSFLDALTEIERLLIMRSNPPAPPAIRFDTNKAAHHHHETDSHATPAVGDCVLGSDDLGMLMLHIHELRTILWQQRRRFSPSVLRSVSEDLAELSGERGAVSVRQQLLIVERMNRAYSFLKQGAID